MDGTDLHSEPGRATVIAGIGQEFSIHGGRCQLLPVGGILRVFHAKGLLLIHHECA